MDTSIPKLVVGLGMAGFNEKEHISVAGVELYYSIMLSKWFDPDLIYHLKLQSLSAILCRVCLSE